MASGPKKIETRGGKREGSGRKLKTVSEYQLALLSTTLKKFKNETGKSIYDILGSIIYGTDGMLVRVGERLAAIKLVMDSTIAKTSEKDITVTSKNEPSIYLPEQLPDPAKVVAIQGGKR